MLKKMQNTEKPYSLLWKYFGNSYAVGSITALFIQQLIVASSTILIVLLSETIIEKKDFSIYLLLFIASLILVYIPGIIASFFTEQVRFKAFNHFIQDFVQVQKGHASLYNNKTYRKNHEPMLTNEGEVVINEITSLFHDWLALFLNTSLSIIALGLVVNSSLICGYFLGAVLFIIIVYLTKNKLQHLALVAQNEQKDMTHVLLTGWDNILINNHYNVSLWKNLFKIAWLDCKTTVISYQLWSNAISSAAMVAALIPVLSITIWLFITNLHNEIVLAVLVVTLPRQIQLIQNVFQIFDYALHWSGLQGKIGGLLQSLTPPIDLNSVEERIDWQKLFLKDKEETIQFHSIEALTQYMKTSSQGRLTVLGENGAGKSSLLCALKEVYEDQAQYLSPMSTLCFLQSHDCNLSTGQRMMSWLQEIQNEPARKVLLLDEWDANLDKTNKEKYSAIIDCLAQSTLVLEVRHNLL
jgi:hypothetical protein